MRTILGHLLAGRLELLPRLAPLKHVWVETSLAPLWMNTDEKRAHLVTQMQAAGMQRFVFGSDWPIIHPAETVWALTRLPLEPEELDQITHQNAAAFDDLFTIESAPTATQAAE